MITEVPRWPHQIYAVEKVIDRIESGVQRLCVTSPTGGGKSLVMIDLMNWALEQGWNTVLYTNRQLLCEQLICVLGEAQMPFGVRAAAYEDYYDPTQAIQISMSPTESARVLRRRSDAVRTRGMSERQALERYSLHRAQLVIVDEAHMQMGNNQREIVREHENSGGYLVLITATPLGLHNDADELIVAGTNSDLRKCGALVPAHVFAPDELDTRKLEEDRKTYREGEDFSASQIQKIWTPLIFGRVFDHWKVLNPAARPAVCFAPGVRESQWFAEQFEGRGVKAASIDAKKIWVDGTLYNNSRQLRAEVIGRFRDGEIKVVCNRYVMREGIDIPELYHVILACPIGSLLSYIQSVGRVLRRSQATPDHVIVQDHGGNFWRHGSPNEDRDWEAYWSVEPRIATRHRLQRMRERKLPEPYVCPNCKAARRSGSKCWKCGHESTRRSRIVLQSDGTLAEVTGNIVKARRIRQREDTQDIWKKYFYRARNSRNQMTFTQAEALFLLENGYYPPRSLDFMPVDDLDWFNPVVKVKADRVRWPDGQIKV